LGFHVNRHFTVATLLQKFPSLQLLLKNVKEGEEDVQGKPFVITKALSDATTEDDFKLITTAYKMFPITEYEQ
jgi:hypothetical protein